MIFVDDSIIKVGGTLLPGIVKSLEIKDDAHVEEQEVEGAGKKPKQAEGYEDAKITIEMILINSENQTAMEKLGVIQNLFKMAGQKNPAVHEFVNEHTAARRITSVIFKSFSSKYESKREQLTATLEFWSYEAMTITATVSANGGAASKSTGSTNSTSTAASSNLSAEYQSYLSNNRGNAPNKTSRSPANDNT